MLDEVTSLLPDIDARAPEIEAARSVPPDVFDKLRALGAPHMLVPRRFGGEEVGLPEAMRVIERLATVDGSIAWTTMIAAGFAYVWARFPADVQARVYADGADVLARGALAPRGTATRVDGGFRVAGRWPLASGSYDCQWVFATCSVLPDGGAAGEHGTVAFRIVALPARSVRFLETWDALGLRATASDDFVVEDAIVSDDWTIDALESGAGDPLAVVPLLPALSASHCALVLGLAGRLLDDVAQLLRVRRPVFNPGILSAEDPGVQAHIGELSARHTAARALAYDELGAMWQRALEGEPSTVEERSRVRAAVAHVHGECLTIGDLAFRLGGTAVLGSGSAAQRRWRDLHTAGQHVIADPAIHRTVGALRLGADPAQFATV